LTAREYFSAGLLPVYGVLLVDTFFYPDQSFIPATKPAEFRYR
jgi:hypothetical protein